MLKYLLVSLLSFVFAVTYLCTSATPSVPSPISVITNSSNLEHHLAPFAPLLGPQDYPAYRGHVYRTLTYALHLLPPAAAAAHRKTIEIALVYHDIGLWTDEALAYVEPSWARAEKDLAGKGLGVEEMELVRNIVLYHHKVTRFEGAEAMVVNAVIKADLCDFSMGMVRGRVLKENVARTVAEMPYLGFHEMLAGFGQRLHGRDFWTIGTELAKIFYW